MRGRSKRVCGALTLIALLALSAPAIPGPTASASDAGFTDVPDTHAFHDDISWMAAESITGGFPDGTFRPALPVSRQGMAAFLHSFDGGGASTLTEPYFADVPMTHGFYDDIQWMAEEGISTGTPQAVGKPLYKPTLAVSRQAMAAFLHNYDTALDPTLRCNGARELCDRAYNAVSYATTHNAMGSIEDGWIARNQQWAMPRQFADGVRAVMLDTHYNSTLTAPLMAAPEAPDDTPLLCHGYCKYGWMLLTDGLTDIKTFLDENPNEVMTIIFESYVPFADTKADFEAVGLLDMAIEHTPGTPWPTLREMIATNKRLVVLTDSGGGVEPWYMDVWDEAFETHWSAWDPEDLSCDPNRGDPANSLFILNHFLSRPTAAMVWAQLVNHNPFFVERALECQTARSHLPNFPTVDFYAIGNLFDVVDTLNGL